VIICCAASGGQFNNIGDLDLASEKVAEALASYTRAKELIEPLVKAQPKAELYEIGLAFSQAGLGRAHAGLGAATRSEVSADDGEAEARLAVKFLNVPMEAGYRSVSELRADRDFKAPKERVDLVGLRRSIAVPKNVPAPAKGSGGGN
jgi:hypothetical protein